MSTIDRVIVYNKSCPCGMGKIVITECSPDHPYAKDSQTWYQAEIDCDICKHGFEFNEITKDEERSIILQALNGGETVLKKSIQRYCRGLSK